MQIIAVLLGLAALGLAAMGLATLLQATMGVGLMD